MSQISFVPPKIHVTVTPNRFDSLRAVTCDEPSVVSLQYEIYTLLTYHYEKVYCNGIITVTVTL
jgi:hypothetical protein